MSGLWYVMAHLEFLYVYQCKRMPRCRYSHCCHDQHCLSLLPVLSCPVLSYPVPQLQILDKPCVTHLLQRHQQPRDQSIQSSNAFALTLLYQGLAGRRLCIVHLQPWQPHQLSTSDRITVPLPPTMPGQTSSYGTIHPQLPPQLSSSFFSSA